MRSEAMSFETFIVFFSACILQTIISGLLSSMCSCYFPYLLSWRAYYVVKNKRMQEILIAGQRNRSRDSKTAPEDRNKMTFLGCVCWLINFFWTVSTYSILIYLYVMSIILPYEESIALLEQWSPIYMCFFRIEYLFFFCFMMVLYQLDYSIGKWIYLRKPKYK